jgi:hypothetical protein
MGDRTVNQAPSKKVAAAKFEELDDAAYSDSDNEDPG